MKAPLTMPFLWMGRAERVIVRAWGRCAVSATRAAAVSALAESYGEEEAMASEG